MVRYSEWRHEMVRSALAVLVLALVVGCTSDNEQTLPARNSAAEGDSAQTPAPPTGGRSAAQTPAPPTGGRSAAPTADSAAEDSAAPDPSPTPGRGADTTSAPAAAHSTSANATAGGDQPQSTLDDVTARGTLRCALRQEWPPSGFDGLDGAIRFDIDVCRAIAAAVLGDATGIEFVNARDHEIRAELLANGAIDVLIDTATAAPDASSGMDFARPTFYTGQAFAVRTDSGIESTADMEGATICVVAEWAPQVVVANHFTAIGVRYLPLAGGHWAVAGAFFSGRCEVLTAYASDLALWIGARDDRDDYTILPQIISREALAPAVRQDDSRWRDIVNWVVHGLIRAEEMGITQKNVASMALNPPSIAVATLLGVPYKGGVPDLGFGAGPQFIQRAIAAVGNYGEIYARTIGDTIPRACTPNALAIDDSVDCPPGSGGTLYALPYR